MHIAAIKNMAMERDAWLLGKLGECGVGMIPLPMAGRVRSMADFKKSVVK
jgi:hypothetical protein